MPQQYPRVVLPLEPKTATVSQVAQNSILNLAPNWRLWNAQDSIPGQARRVLAEYGLMGSVTWAVPAGTTDPSPGPGFGQRYPERDTWRTVAVSKARVTPGCKLEMHCLYCPAGLTQWQVAVPPNEEWRSAGAFAKLRAVVTWTNGASTSGPHNFTMSMGGSNKGTWTGGANTVAAGDWNDLREKLVYDITPPEYENDPTVAVLYSEWSDVTIELQVLGGERIVHAIVYEVPSVHVQNHNTTGAQTVHGAPDTNPSKPRRPQTDKADGATYQHHRWGTTRVLQTADRQGERLGIRVLNFAANLHDGTGWNATDQTPITVTNTAGAYVNLFDTSLTNYNTGHPGWIVAGSMAQLHRLDAEVMMRGLSAVIPVRAQIDALWTGASGSGLVRLQSGTYEWLEATFATTTTRQTKTVNGYLEAQVYGDQFRAILLPLLNIGGTDIDVFNISIDFGMF